MIQKFLKELKAKEKQTDRSASAESAATEQVETTAREIIYETVRFPRTGRNRNTHTDFSAHSQPEQSELPNHMPDVPRQRTDDLRIKSEAKQRYISASAPQKPPQRKSDMTMPMVTDKPSQNVSIPTPQEQMRQAFVEKQKRLSQNPSIHRIGLSIQTGV